MVVKEMQVGRTVIRIHDDSVVQTEEEVKEILRRCSEIVSRYPQEVKK